MCLRLDARVLNETTGQEDWVDPAHRANLKMPIITLALAVTIADGKPDDNVNTGQRHWFSEQRA